MAKIKIATSAATGPPRIHCPLPPGKPPVARRRTLFARAVGTAPMAGRTLAVRAGDAPVPPVDRACFDAPPAGAVPVRVAGADDVALVVRVAGRALECAREEAPDRLRAIGVPVLLSSITGP